MKANNKNRGGRPLKSSEKKKAVRFDMRMEEAEKQAFHSAAELAGLDLSAWIRQRLRRAARDELAEAGKPIAFLPG